MSSKTKVCILSNGLARGGTDTFVVNLVKYLNKDIFDILVVNSCDTEKCVVREPEILAESVPVLRTGNANASMQNRIKHFYRLYKILKKGKVDVFQTNIDLYNGPQLFVAWLARVPVRVCHSHNSQQALEIRDGRTLSVRLYQGLMRWLCWNFSTRRCGCSEEAMDFLFKGHEWRQDKYPFVIYNGIDLGKFKKPIDKDKKRAELGLTAKKLILTVGQMVLQKNPEFIVTCISEYLRKHDDTDFVWVGIGPYRGQIDEWIRNEDMTSRFHFLGSRNDVNEIMQCCNAFFLPSNFEGLGIVMIEAQAAGLSCVASTGVPLLADCGKVRFISLDDSMGKWHSALEDALAGAGVLDDNRLSSFSMENMANQMTQIFTNK